MQPLTFPTAKYIILHGHAKAPAPVLLSYTPPAKVWTAQPNVEDFDDAQAAITRAIELGVAPLLTTEFWPVGKVLDLATATLVDHGEPVPWAADGTYAKNSLVTMDGVTWLHISDRQGTPDETYDLAAGTGDYVPFYVKPAPAPPTAEAKLAALEARLAALETA